MKILVMTSDHLIHSMIPFAYLFNKYWDKSQSVIYAGFSKPDFTLPSNFQFVSLGNQNDYPFNRWSDAFYKALNLIDDTHVVVMLEDYWLIRHVDLRAIKVIWDYSKQFNYVIRFDLTTDRRFAHGSDCNYGHVEHIDLVKSMPGSPYHLSLMAAVWNIQSLKKVLIPAESPHDIELIGTTRLSHEQEMLVLGTHQGPVKYSLGYRRGNENPNLEELNIEDKRQVATLLGIK